MIFATPLVVASLLNSLAGPAPKPVSPPPGPAVQSIKAARALGAGATVTVRAVVLNGPELGGLRYV